MARLVMKFGGTSVANVDRIRNAARHVKREVAAGHEVAVVVSAMAGATSCPASVSRLTWRAALRMRSTVATEVPPNFITRRAMASTGRFLYKAGKAG